VNYCQAINHTCRVGIIIAATTPHHHGEIRTFLRRLFHLIRAESLYLPHSHLVRPPPLSFVI
jgi:hypothetical protein